MDAIAGMARSYRGIPSIAGGFSQERACSRTPPQREPGSRAITMASPSLLHVQRQRNQRYSRALSSFMKSRWSWRLFSQ
jgi:hypothetical protein